jgi:hypothetical protein
MSPGRPDRPLRRWRHPGKKQVFEEVGDGTVRVIADDGRTGIFELSGRYVMGDLTQASVHMIVWTGQPHLPEAFDYRWTLLPIDVERESGWPEVQERAIEALCAIKADDRSEKG